MYLYILNNLKTKLLLMLKPLKISWMQALWNTYPYLAYLFQQSEVQCRVCVEQACRWGAAQTSVPGVVAGKAAPNRPLSTYLLYLFGSPLARTKLDFCASQTTGKLVPCGL